MKRKDQIEKIKKNTPEELKARALEIADELLKIRFKQASGQHDGAARRPSLKVELARLKTELKAKSANNKK